MSVWSAESERALLSFAESSGFDWASVGAQLSSGGFGEWDGEECREKYAEMRELGDEGVSGDESALLAEFGDLLEDEGGGDGGVGDGGDGGVGVGGVRGVKGSDFEFDVEEEMRRAEKELEATVGGEVARRRGGGSGGGVRDAFERAAAALGSVEVEGEEAEALWREVGRGAGGKVLEDVEGGEGGEAGRWEEGVRVLEEARESLQKLLVDRPIGERGKAYRERREIEAEVEAQRRLLEREEDVKEMTREVEEERERERGRGGGRKERYGGEGGGFFPSLGGERISSMEIHMALAAQAATAAGNPFPHSLTHSSSASSTSTTAPTLSLDPELSALLETTTTTTTTTTTPHLADVLAVLAGEKEPEILPKRGGGGGGGVGVVEEDEIVPTPDVVKEEGEGEGEGEGEEEGEEGGEVVGEESVGSVPTTPSYSIPISPFVVKERGREGKGGEEEGEDGEGLEGLLEEFLPEEGDADGEEAGGKEETGYRRMGRKIRAEFVEEEADEDDGVEEEREEDLMEERRRMKEEALRLKRVAEGRTRGM